MSYQSVSGDVPLKNKPYLSTVTVELDEGIAAWVGAAVRLPPDLTSGTWKADAPPQSEEDKPREPA